MVFESRQSESSPLTEKLVFEGVVRGVQPRVRLHRSFDERWHTYHGYAVHLDGNVDGEAREFSIGIGKAAQAKHALQVGFRIDGLCRDVEDPRTEVVDFYKVSKLRVTEGHRVRNDTPPPWVGATLTLPEYRARGHRRLAARTYDTSCTACIWGARMAVEMTIDPWNRSKKRYRVEAFCYGPKSCPAYKPGPQRTVPGRSGATYVEEDWVDEEEVAHRGADD